MAGGPTHEPVETDMTPMIDVTFQLIIFFICTIKFKTLEGKLETLTRILARRFGPLPGWVDERLRHAGAEQLDAWLDRCVDAPTLAEVLGEH